MLNPQECVLVVVDVQGKLAQVMDSSAELHQTLLNLIKGTALFDIPTLWLEQLPDKLGQTSPLLYQELIKQSSPIAKQHFSGWQAEQFKEQLTALNRTQVLLAGIESHVCVYQTCSDLLENDFDVHLIVDAISSRTAANKLLGIEMMQHKGAQISNMESLLFELQHEAVGERFKALLKLIK